MSSGNRTDISLEDPDFWQKWAKKAELDLDAIHGKVSRHKKCVWGGICFGSLLSCMWEFKDGEVNDGA